MRENATIRDRHDDPRIGVRRMARDLDARAQDRFGDPQESSAGESPANAAIRVAMSRATKPACEVLDRPLMGEPVRAESATVPRGIRIRRERHNLLRSVRRWCP